MKLWRSWTNARELKEISAMHESKANSQIESMYEKRYNCILVQGYQKKTMQKELVTEQIIDWQKKISEQILAW